VASYKDRLTGDLDAWIAKGLVPASSRTAILDSVGETRRPDAANALGYIGAALLGLALIAFVAANWGAIPRIGRYGLITALFAAGAAGGAWAAATDRKVLANLLLLFAALVFAADIGLSGQIFDLTGDPQTALYSGAVAAALLALAGRSSAAAAVALVFVTLGDGMPTLWSHPFGIAVGAVAATALAFVWRSPVLAHAAGIGLIIGGFEVIWRLFGPDPLFLAPVLVHHWPAFLGAAGVFVVAALAARMKGGDPAQIVHGWLVLGALAFLMAAGTDSHGLWKVVHRVAITLAAIGVIAIGRRERGAALQVIGWLGFWVSVMIVGFDIEPSSKAAFGLRMADRMLGIAGSVAMIVFGRIDRNRWVTALGALFMATAISATLIDLGLSLGAAAGVFALVAAGALGLAIVLRRGASR
jgi:uncharacterized membrane protein